MEKAQQFYRFFGGDFFMGKRVKVVPVVGSNEPVDVELPEGMSIREAIVQTFPNVQGNLVMQDEASRPISPSTQLKDVQEIRFMPYTTGGLRDGVSKKG